MSSRISGTTSESEVIDAFCDAMAAAGLACADKIVANGRWRHYRIVGQKKRNGSYQLHADPPANGRFKSWAGGPTHEWRPEGGGRIVVSPTQQAANRRKAERRRKRDTKKKSDAAARANEKWEAATPVESHPYLARKCVASYGLRSLAMWEKNYRDDETGEWHTARLPDALLVPMRDGAGNIVSLQAIFGEKHDVLADGAGGDKDFLAGGQAKGAFHVVGDLRDVSTIVVAEGYATAASIHAAMDGMPVVVALFADNLLPVSEIIRRQNPKATIVIAGDNDCWSKDGRPASHKGRQAAGDAAAADEVRGIAAIADICAIDPRHAGTDYNDVHVHHPDGLAEVRRQIKAALTKAAAETAITETAGPPQPPLSIPRYPAASGTLDEARALISATANEWAASVPGYHCDSDVDVTDPDNADADDADDIDYAPPPVTFERVDTGIGKTEVSIRVAIELIPHAKANSRGVLFAAPNHALNDELQARFQKDAAAQGYIAHVYRGRGADDPEFPGEKMCRRHEEAQDIGYALSAAEKLCSSGGEVCPFAGVCGTKRQEAKKADLWIVPHALIFQKKPKLVPDVEALIVDESSLNATLCGFSYPVRLPFDEIRRLREVRWNGVDDLGATNDLKVVLDKIADVVEASGDTIRRDDLIAAGITAASTKNAGKVLWGCKAPVPVTAAMSEKDINAIITKAKLVNGDLRKVIRLVDFITETIEARSPYIFGTRIERQVKMPYGSVVDVVRQRWGQKIPKTWHAPTLAMDATGDEKTVGATFPGLEKFVAASAPMPNVRVRQIPWSASAGKLIVRDCWRREAEARCGYRENRGQ
jgi:phage/plasmid primase-like uncharacterized protein